MADENLLQNYAELVVRVGANVQKGQDVAISSYVEQAPFARALAKASYEAGARYVATQYHDQFIKRELIVHGDDDVLEWSPPWDIELTSCEWAERTSSSPATRTRTSSPTSTASGSARRGRRPSASARCRSHSRRDDQLDDRGLSERAVGDEGVRRAGRGPALGGSGEGRAARPVRSGHRLAGARQAASLACSVDDGAPLRCASLQRPWHGSDDRPHARVQLGSGTLETSGGIVHVPNMPTEEVFTAPDARRTEGTVRSTQPLAACPVA